jgi:hypothetical protein
LTYGVDQELRDTAVQRAATGLDEGARALMIGVVVEVADLDCERVANSFFRDRFGGLSDYLAAVREVWGEETSYRLGEAINRAHESAQSAFNFGEITDPSEAAARALLLNAPEPDFRLATGAALETIKGIGAASERITKICRGRGIPWAFSHLHGFEYVGDETVERDQIRPALAAINRPEFAGGVRAEFESARAELATGTPAALKQSVHEAACSVESAMKVVLEAHDVVFGPGDTSSPLFNHLEAAGIVPRHMEFTVLVAMVPRNRIGGHGAGAQPHAVDPEEAGAIVAGAGGAIAYLATRLP